MTRSLFESSFVRVLGIAFAIVSTTAPCSAETSDLEAPSEQVSPVADSPVRAPHARAPTYGRFDPDVVLVWRRDARGRTTSTCRVWPDATETCLSHPIPRAFVGRTELAGGFVGLAVGALAIAIGVHEHRSCGAATDALGHCGGMAGLATGTVFAAAGLGVIVLGSVRTAQYRRGVRELLSLSRPMAPSVRLELRGTGLALHARF